MAKRYRSSSSNTNPRVYEIVCLLRLNGMRVERAGPTTFKVRISHLNRHIVHTMTLRELMAKYRHDQKIYELLRSHPKANTIKVAPPPSRRHRRLVG